MKVVKGLADSSDFMVNAEIGSPDTPSGRTIGSAESSAGVGMIEILTI